MDLPQLRAPQRTLHPLMRQLRHPPPRQMTPLPTEHDILELGTRAAFWLAAAHGDPTFMLAMHQLLAAPPRKRMSLADYRLTSTSGGQPPDARSTPPAAAPGRSPGR